MAQVSLSKVSRRLPSDGWGAINSEPSICMTIDLIGTFYGLEISFGNRADHAKTCCLAKSGCSSANQVFFVLLSKNPGHTDVQVNVLELEKFSFSAQNHVSKEQKNGGSLVFE